MPLNTQPHFFNPSGARQRYAYSPGDDFYDALIAGHRGLSDEESELMQARLVLLLANHIGDLTLLREAIALARQGVGSAPGGDKGEAGSACA
ncbi:MAG: DUF2783 domain-containing protein [Pseudomonadota bacterium]